MIGPILFLTLVSMKKLFSFLFVFLLISCSKDVEETIKFTLTATANPTEGGTVSPTNGQYESGDVATVTATPNAEYVFEKWTGGVTGTSSSVSVTMNGNKSVVANFIKKQYPLTIEIEGEGTVTETVIKQGLATDYNSGTIVELTAVPKDGWEFVEWTGDLTGSENPTQITIDRSKAVKAKFEFNINYFELFSGINKLTSHYQPFNIPFVDYADLINKTVSSDGCVIIWSSFGFFNDNDIPDVVLSEGDCATEDKSELFIVIDNELKYSFVSPQAVTRKFLIGDIDQNGYDDIVLIGTGIDTDPYTGDSTHVVYMSDIGYSIKELDPQKGYFHTGTMGDLNNDGHLDIMPFNNQGFNKYTPDAVPVFYGNGSGTFEKDYTNIPYHRIARMYQSELFDINKDGNLDLIMGGSEWDEDWFNNAADTIFWRTAIYLGKGDGTFDLENRILIPKIDGWGIITDFDVYDLNNDGAWEIIITRTSGDGSGPMVENDKSYDGIKIQILEFKNGEVSQVRLLDQPETWFSNTDMVVEWPYKTLVYDVNKDGRLDLIPESDHLNSASHQPTKDYRGLYYEQRFDGNFEIKYFTK